MRTCASLLLLAACVPAPVERLPENGDTQALLLKIGAPIHPFKLEDRISGLSLSRNVDTRIALAPETLDALTLEGPFVSYEGAVRPCENTGGRPIPDSWPVYVRDPEAGAWRLTPGGFDDVRLPPLDLEKCAERPTCLQFDGPKLFSCRTDCGVAEWPEPTLPTPPSPPRADLSDRAECADTGEAHFIGTTGCLPVQTTCVDGWPNVSGDVVWVRADGVGAGSRDDPYGSITDALLTSSVTIALGPGTYPPISVTRDVTIVGCGPDTIIQAAANAPAVLVQARAVLDDVTLEGGVHGIVVDATGDLTVRRLVMRDVESAAAVLGSLVIDTSLIRSQTGVGCFSGHVEILGSELQTTSFSVTGSCVLRMSDAIVGSLGGGAISMTGPNTDIVVERSLLTTRLGNGVFVQDGEMELRDVRVTNALGNAISLDGVRSATVTRVRVDGEGPQWALIAGGGSDTSRDIRVEDLDVSWTNTEAAGGLAVTNVLRASVSRVRIVGGSSRTVYMESFPKDAIVTLEDVDIEGGKVEGMTFAGSATVERIRVRGAAIGILIANTDDTIPVVARLSNATIEDPTEVGIRLRNLKEGSTADLEEIRIIGATAEGLSTRGLVNATIHNLFVEGFSTGLSMLEGLQIEPSTNPELTLTDFRIVDAGIAIDAAIDRTKLVVGRGEIERAAVGFQRLTCDLREVASEVRFVDVETFIQDSQ